MANKTFVYLGLGAALLLFFGTIVMGGLGNINGRTISNLDNNDDMAGHHAGKQPVSSNSQSDMSDHHSGGSQPSISSNEDLSKYRSEDVPVDCRLPDYNNDVKKWAEHLSHHQETQFCLEFYKEDSTPKSLVSSSESSDMPEKCRQPAGRDRDSWKEHLGHHQETQECLQYF